MTRRLRMTLGTERPDIRQAAETVVRLYREGRLEDVLGVLDDLADAVEREAPTPVSVPPLAPTPIEVEAWVAGYLAGREDDMWRTDDEIAERAVDATCAVRMDALATVESSPERKGGE